MTTNSELRRLARRHLDGRWGDMVLCTLLYYIISLFVSVFAQLGNLFQEGELFSGLQMLAGPFIALSLLLAFLLIPLEWGLYVNFLRVRREEQSDIASLFRGYADFWRVFSTMFLLQLYTLLWSLLLIVPGIVKALSYALTPFILKDYPQLSRGAAIRLSRQMMSGNKGRLFLLYLSFLGWAFLALFTCGIGFLWLVPYMGVSLAEFYEDAKSTYENAIGGPAQEPVAAGAGE